MWVGPQRIFIESLTGFGFTSIIRGRFSVENSTSVMFPSRITLVGLVNSLCFISAANFFSPNCDDARRSKQIRSTLNIRTVMIKSAIISY